MHAHDIPILDSSDILLECTPHESLEYFTGGADGAMRCSLRRSSLAPTFDSSTLHIAFGSFPRLQLHPDSTVVGNMFQAFVLVLMMALSSGYRFPVRAWRLAQV